MASLLTVTGRQIELEAGRPFVLGRSPECDVVIEDLACSRRHARITLARRPGTALIEDLGSRNGTFVYDERIYQRTRVEDGARIRLGTTHYLLQLRGADAEEDEETPEALLDTGTVSIERLSLGRDIDPQVLRVMQGTERATSTEFAGQFGAIGVIDILQLLMRTGRNGRLQIELQAGSAAIEFRDGDVVAASYLELEGFHALLMLARQTAGLYWLVDSSEPCLRTIHEPASVLLFELCRALDEESAPARSAGS
jgi:pSer/pThr/pTyr-binding forkhead associated (FHA) protein